MNLQTKHEPYCFAGQPALCSGYFEGDMLPCICGTEGDAITALSELALPAPVCERAGGHEGGRGARADIRLFFALGL